MTTRPELERELHRRFDGKPIDELAGFMKSLELGISSNVAWKTDAETIENNIKRVCDKVDRFGDKYLLPTCRALGLPTPAEQNTILARESVETAKRSADAAESSAHEANRSANYAKWSIGIAVFSAAIAILALLLQLGE